MHFTFRNVNDAFRNLVNMIHTKSIPTITTDSRNGPVIQIPEPVIITYTHPKERVLFNSARDANPFFHLYESLWMLAGRNDVESLAYYNSKISQYSDDGKTFNGAYGYRWKNSQVLDHQNWDDGDGVNQLQIIIEHLKSQPNSRRAVLQMWNVEDDLLKIGSHIRKSRLSNEYFSTPQKAEEFAKNNGYPEGCIRRTDEKTKQTDFGQKRYYLYDENATEFSASKDVCCNTQVMFSIREVVRQVSQEEIGDRIDTPGWGPTKLFPDRYLDMTVINRSNDMIWGALGANVVHFSFLQEYMAANIGVEVGVYNQISNNLHVYLNNWKPEEWLNAIGVNGYSDYFMKLENVRITPLVKDPKMFEKNLVKFVDQGHSRKAVSLDFGEPFLDDVALPMVMAYCCYKQRQISEAISWCKQIKSLDWNVACTNWLERRK